MSDNKQGPQKKKKSTKGEGKRLKKLLPILCFTLLCYFGCILICAFWLLKSDHSEFFFPYSIGALGVAAFLSAFFAGLCQKKNGLLTGFLTTFPMHVVILLLSFVFGGYQADLTLLFTLVILTLISMLGGVLAVNRREKTHKTVKQRKTGRVS